MLAGNAVARTSAPRSLDQMHAEMTALLALQT